MYSLMLALDNAVEELERFDTAEEAVADLRSNWNEDTGPLLAWVQDDAGRHVAVLLRPDPEGDPELCLTLWADGRVERIRCRYLLDAPGRYKATVSLDAGRKDGGGCSAIPPAPLKEQTHE